MPKRLIQLMVAAGVSLFATPCLSAQEPERNAEIQRRIAALEAQLAELKALVGHKPTPVTQPTAADQDRSDIDDVHSVKFGAALDTYYGYNFNRPIGRVNLLRAY